MGWDFDKRRKSRWCLFPVDKLGDDSAEEPDDELDAYFGFSSERGRCGSPDTNMDGLCPLHAGLPYQNMTDAAWEHVREAIRHRRAAMAATAAAWDEVDSRINNRQQQKVDKWNQLVRTINSGGQVNWKGVTVEQKIRLAGQTHLPERLALDLLQLFRPKHAAELDDDDDDDHEWTRRRRRNPDPREDVRLELAGNAGRSDAVVRALLDDPNPEVRKVAIRVQNFPDDIDLVHHSEPDVREAAAARVTLPDDEELIHTMLSDPATTEAVLRNDSLTPDRIDQITIALTDRDGWLWRRLQDSGFVGRLNEHKSSGYGAYDYSHYGRRGGGEWRHRLLGTIASNRSAGIATLDRLARSEHLRSDDLMAIVQNPNTSTETLELLADGRLKKVGEAAASKLREQTDEPDD